MTIRCVWRPFTFLFQPTFMDILPQYIVYMIFAPFLVKLCIDGKWAYVMAGSLLVWMAGQLGLQQLFTAPMNEIVKGVDEQGIRVSFNLFGCSWCSTPHWYSAR